MKSKTVFICKQCGNETPRWQGPVPRVRGLELDH